MRGMQRRPRTDSAANGVACSDWSSGRRDATQRRTANRGRGPPIATAAITPTSIRLGLLCHCAAVQVRAVFRYRSGGQNGWIVSGAGLLPSHLPSPVVIRVVSSHFRFRFIRDEAREFLFAAADTRGRRRAGNATPRERGRAAACATEKQARARACVCASVSECVRACVPAWRACMGVYARARE